MLHFHNLGFSLLPLSTPRGEGWGGDYLRRFLLFPSGSAAPPEDGWCYWKKICDGLLFPFRFLVGSSFRKKNDDRKIAPIQMWTFQHL